jgi:transposase InsO family protein
MKRHRHTPEQIVRKLREGDRLLNEGKDLSAVLRHLEISESSWNRWRARYGGMKVNEAKRPGSLLEAQVLVDAWRVEYNTYRPHSSLGGLTPAEYAEHPTITQPALP